MKTSPKELARAFYLSVKDASENEVGPLTANFVAVAKRHGIESMLHDALASLPEVMESVDALERVTIETASPIDEKHAASALKAAGIDSEGREVVRSVNPDLVGGIRIKTKDKVIDASVRRYLEDLKETVAPKSL